MEFFKSFFDGREPRILLREMLCKIEFIANIKSTGSRLNQIKLEKFESNVSYFI